MKSIREPRILDILRRKEMQLLHKLQQQQRKQRHKQLKQTIMQHKRREWRLMIH